MLLSTCYIGQSLVEGLVNGHTLIKYDLTFEPLKTLKDQVLADFIIEHGIDLDEEVNYLTFTPWKLYFNRSVCKDGQGVGIIMISPNGVEVGMSSRLEFRRAAASPKLMLSF